MIKLSPDGSPVAGRLKEARNNLGISQKKLGELAGLDPNSASARMNQYETGKHSPDFRMLQMLAEVLNVPVAFFYTTDREVARLLIKLHLMDKNQKEELLKNLN